MIQLLQKQLKQCEQLQTSDNIVEPLKPVKNWWRNDEETNIEHVIEWNPMMAELTAYSHDEAMGRDFVSGFVDDRYKSLASEVLSKALKGISTPKFEMVQ